MGKKRVKSTGGAGNSRAARRGVDIMDVAEPGGGKAGSSDWAFGVPAEAAALMEGDGAAAGPAASGGTTMDTAEPGAGPGGPGTAGSGRKAASSAGGGTRGPGSLNFGFAMGGIKKKKAQRGVSTRHQRSRKARLAHKAAAVAERRLTKAGRKGARAASRKAAKDLY